VRLQGKPLFESVEGEHPSTVPHAAGPMAQPVRLGQYLIEKELGRGGMGVVYRAYDTQRHQTVALKVLLAVGQQDRRHLVRFVEEASTMDRLEHRNIVQVYDIGLQGEVPYLALEYLELGSLHRKSDGKPVEPRYAAYLVAGMADGIQHAHEHGVLHRDLKPANILLRAHSPKAGGLPGDFLEEPVISDFGLAKRLDSLEQVTQTGQAVGTPNYMSPEQAAGHKELLGPAVDIYGLGPSFMSS
ncbi:MAG TPA: serine/threonine-protein kinase, partial [Gemmatales bacterium]|nr:serine/threonine-protein kinase [Gemmatales bacterium]